MATTASVYNISRTTRQILRRHRKYKASLILHLHNNHFRFERQNGMFLFDSPVKQFIRYIRDQKVPADLIDVLTEAGVQFFEGCLLVEIHDHRTHAVSEQSGLSGRDLHRLSAGEHGSTSKSNPLEPPDIVDPDIMANGPLASTLFYLQEGGRYGARSLIDVGSQGRTGGASGAGVEVYRIVLHPTSETLWSDIKMLDELAGSTWTDQDALEVEAKILALTAPPLCLTPDTQATRIANLMLSSTAPPSAYSPGKDSPFQTGKKRTANSIEMEKEQANHQRREKIMRLMEHGLKTYVPAHLGPNAGAAAAVGGLSAAGSRSGTSSSSSFVPTFGRMAFIEKWRMGKNMGGGSLGMPTGPAGSNAPGAGPKKEGKTSANGDKDEGDDGSAAKKPPSKKKKKAQREKEEAEAAAAAEAAKKAEEEGNGAAGAKKPKKKMTKKEREEKERRELEEKAQAEERERLEKEVATLATAAAEAAAAASSNAKPIKGKSKKKQKEEAAAAAAAAAAASAALAAVTNGTSAPDSPDKDKKPSPKKTGSKKPATASTTAGKKPKSPAKANVAGSAADTTNTPLLGSATPSLQSTPTNVNRSIPLQQLQQQQQQQQLRLQQQSQAANIYDGSMQMSLNNGQSFGTPNSNGIGFGMPMMNNTGASYPVANNAMQQALGNAQFGGAMQQGIGLGLGGNANNMMNFAGMNIGHHAQNPAISQMMGLMLPGSNNATYPNQHQQQQQQQQLQQQQLQLQQQQLQQRQQQQQQGATGGANGGSIADLPVGVGLSNLGNWGSSS